MGFEANLNNNARRKELINRPLLTDLTNDYQQVKFINICISCLDIFRNSSDSFLKLCIERGIENRDLNFIISKLSTIVIRSTYPIFCKRNKAWSDPELLNYYNLSIQLLCTDVRYFSIIIIFLSVQNGKPAKCKLPDSEISI